eukprot:3811424-Prymnesium_polylepis.1
MAQAAEGYTGQIVSQMVDRGDVAEASIRMEPVVEEEEPPETPSADSFPDLLPGGAAGGGGGGCGAGGLSFDRQ